MVSPARVAAYEILLAVSRGRTDLPTAIAAGRLRLEDDRDRALAAEIAAGVQRWRALLDQVIVSFARRDLDRLDPEVVEILRLSAYQLLHLTRVPASAVVDDAVNLTRRAGKKSAAGFVNAILRTVSRKRRELPLPARPAASDSRDAALDYLSVTMSHPRWLAERWLRRYGFEATEQWMQFDNAPAPVTLRVNTIKTDTPTVMKELDDEDVRVHPGRYAPDALIVEAGHPLRTVGARAGRFLVQDEASQLVPLLTAAAPDMRVLDTCASPGGKTTSIAAMMNCRGLLVATDLRNRRVALLQKTVAAAGASNVRIVQTNLLKPLPFRQSFDVVIVDAPCSGLGTLRRDPDIRWRRQEDDLVSLAAVELAMLQNAAEVVARAGRLVYATCSSEPDENDGVVSAFLATTSGFRIVDARTALPSRAAELVDARGFLRTEPHRHGLEAFFGAVLEREL